MFIERFTDSTEKFQSFLGNLTGKPVVKTSMRTGLTLIGPARLIKKIKKKEVTILMAEEAGLALLISPISAIR